MSTLAAPVGVTPSESQPNRARKLPALTLVAATFFTVSGGPFGLEELIGNVGYLRSIIIVLMVPIVWALPRSNCVRALCEPGLSSTRDPEVIADQQRSLGAPAASIL